MAFIWSRVHQKPHTVVLLILTFIHLQAAIAGKRSAAMDYIWALRKDPVYVAEVLRDYNEHRQERKGTVIVISTSLCSGLIPEFQGTDFWAHSLIMITFKASLALSCNRRNMPHLTKA